MRDESQAQRLFSTTPNHNSLPSFFFFATIPLLLSALLTRLTLFSLSCLLPSCTHGITSGSLKSVWVFSVEILDQQSGFVTHSNPVRLQLVPVGNLPLHCHLNQTACSFESGPCYKNHKSNCNLVWIVWIQVLWIWFFLQILSPEIQV